MRRDAKIALAVAGFVGGVFAWQLAREPRNTDLASDVEDDGIWIDGVWYPVGTHPLADVARQIECDARAAGATAGHTITGRYA